MRNTGWLYRVTEEVYDIYYYLVILAAPLIVYGVLLGDTSIRLSRILIIGSLPLLVWRLISKPELLFRDRFCVFCLLPYLFYTMLSALWSQNVETGTTASRLGGLFEVVILYFILQGANLTSERFIKFVKMYALSAVLPAIVALWQFTNNLYHFSQVEVPFSKFAIEGKYNEVVGGRYFVADGEFSRLSGTFAEPVIFASYLCSVVLLSLVLRPRSVFGRCSLRIFQGVLLFIIVFSLSKLALLTFMIGLLYIAYKYKSYRKWLFGVLAIFAGSVLAMSLAGRSSVFDRLTQETGHWALLVECLDLFTIKSYIIGEGIGSVPYGSFHRFALSRVFESGLVGLYFVVCVTALPFIYMQRKSINNSCKRVKVVSIAALLLVVSGLNGYDYFIHLFTWTVLGAVVSCMNALRHETYLALSGIASGRGAK